MNTILLLYHYGVACDVDFVDVLVLCVDVYCVACDLLVFVPEDWHLHHVDY